MEIKFTPQESEDIFYTSLCNAVGTGYMRGYGLEISFDENHYGKVKATLDNPCFEDVLMGILKDGGKLTFEDIEGNGEYTRSITLEDIHNRVQTVTPSVLIDIINGMDDVSHADIVLQTVFFDDVIFV